MEYVDKNFNPRFETIDDFVTRIINAQPKEFRQMYWDKWYKFIEEEPLEYLKLSSEWQQAQFEQWDKIINRPLRIIVNKKEN